MYNMMNVGWRENGRMSTRRFLETRAMFGVKSGDGTSVNYSGGRDFASRLVRIQKMKNMLNQNRWKRSHGDLNGKWRKQAQYIYQNINQSCDLVDCSMWLCWFISQSTKSDDLQLFWMSATKPLQCYYKI